MSINFLVPSFFKKFLKNIILSAYEKYNLGKRDDYRDYDNLKLKIIAGLNENAVCIDIGCNNGEILESLIHYAPNATHYAFEPIPTIVQNLRNKFKDNVKIFEIALSDKVGEAEFNYVVSNPAYSGFKKRGFAKDESTKIIKVKTHLLDNIIPKNEKIKLIKIDVEGAEFFVLRGGIETLKRNKPIVLFECGRGGSDFYDVKPEQIFDLFAECGLQVSLMEYFLYNRGSLDRHEFIGQYNKGYNYEFVAYP